MPCRFAAARHNSVCTVHEARGRGRVREQLEQDAAEAAEWARGRRWEGGTDGLSVVSWIMFG